ncbi:MAG: nucleotidyltransferase family protein [Spirochaetota bacterium]
MAYSMLMNDIVQKLREIKPLLAERFRVREIGVFGSFSRGEEQDDSDLDILVEFSEESFDNYMGLKFELERIFDRPVDLVIPKTLKSRIKDIVEREVCYA